MRKIVQLSNDLTFIECQGHCDVSPNTLEYLSHYILYWKSQKWHSLRYFVPHLNNFPITPQHFQYCSKLNCSCITQNISIILPLDFSNGTEMYLWRTSREDYLSQSQWKTNLSILNPKTLSFFAIPEGLFSTPVVKLKIDKTLKEIF